MWVAVSTRRRKIRNSSNREFETVDNALWDNAFMKEKFGIDGFWDLADNAIATPTILWTMKKNDVVTPFTGIRRDNATLLSFMLSDGSTWDIAFNADHTINVVQGYAKLKFEKV